MAFHRIVMTMPFALLATGVSHSAFATDADAVAKAFSQALSTGNEISVSYDTASESGPSITIENLKITEPETGSIITVSETVLMDAEEAGSGNFEVAEIVMRNGSSTGDGEVSIEKAVATKAILLSEDTVAANSLNTGIVYETLSLESISVTPPDEDEPFIVESIFFDADVTQDYRISGGSGNVDGLALPMGIFSNASPNPADLGYDSVILDASWSGGLDFETSVMDLQNLIVSLRDGGKLTLSGKLSNVPDSWPAGATGPEAMAPLATLTINNLSLTYEDASLAGRILAQQADKQGVSKDQFVQQLAAALPFLLNALNNPPFQAEVAKAVGTFLADPKSLDISANPETPVTGAELFGLVAASPQAIPDRLKVSITANGSN